MAPNGFGQSLGGGGLAKQHPAFTTSVQTEAQVAMGGFTRCKKCLYTDKCQTRTHERKDPDCVLYEKTQWSGTAEAVAAGAGSGSAVATTSSPASPPQSPTMSAFLNPPAAIENAVVPDNVPPHANLTSGSAAISLANAMGGVWDMAKSHLIAIVSPASSPARQPLPSQQGETRH